MTSERLEFCCPDCGFVMLLGEYDDRGHRVISDEDIFSGDDVIMMPRPWKRIMDNVKGVIDENILRCPSCGTRNDVIDWKHSAEENTRPLCHGKISLKFECCGLYARCENKHNLKAECVWCGNHGKTFVCH